MFELSDNELRAVAGGISNGGRGGRGGRGGDAVGIDVEGDVRIAGDGNSLGNGNQTGGTGGGGGNGGNGGTTTINANITV
jgi:hypothetical protein